MHNTIDYTYLSLQRLERTGTIGITVLLIHSHSGHKNSLLSTL